MRYRDEFLGLSVQYDAHHCDLSRELRARFDDDLAQLGSLLEGAPGATLHVEVVRHPRTDDYRVKAHLVIGGGPEFVTGCRDELPWPAFKRCTRSLVQKLEKLQDRRRVDRSPAVERGRHVRARTAPDWDAVSRAVAAGDYPAFRRALALAYEASLARRIARAIGMYPNAAALLGDGLLVSEIVEEVFLNAFERFDHSAIERGFGSWLELLIDPSIRALLDRPGSERENLSFIRTLRAT